MIFSLLYGLVRTVLAAVGPVLSHPTLEGRGAFGTPGAEPGVTPSGATSSLPASGSAVAGGAEPPIACRCQKLQPGGRSGSVSVLIDESAEHLLPVDLRVA